jgi:hypothetical protein
MPLPVIFARLPTGLSPLALFDENFDYLNAKIDARVDRAEPIIIVLAGVAVVTAETQGIVINLAAPGAVELRLPSVAAQNLTELSIADWGGNATITLTPDGGETIMGLLSAVLVSSGQGLGSGAATSLVPSETLNGWWQK